jgi:hypothetical protein
VYSFVLEDNHVMIINGVECVTMGHGFKGSEVIEHPFFGTEKVLEELRRMEGWQRGLVELQAGCLVRDPSSGLVVSLRGSLASGPSF